ncbi:Shikimate dehydrogenase [Desulfamplus magnetovallimortis]|uniref:Shikimate dehydrogenase (NADP(+)) n=1 Tax=Desulfamplus magnetovallimortis TaxID=1246637 RepID=A0A1W1H4V0_9BACT|nr:shikimate dehydrogenase [Desulfamplus magnetovallimortis]SLM27474.1 Shikimate dehydrogenase [Desulfamplus magnetovallimortis]
MSKRIFASTSLYGVMGNPVAHSMGPLIHNTMFQKMDVDAVYLAFEIKDIKKGLDAVRTLGIKGVSVTIPFKESILPFLDEMDPVALKIGAVNTILNRDGYLLGYNTDCDGAVEPLKIATSIINKNVFIFGAGGAARAVAFGIAREGGKISIINRDETKGKKLAEEINGRFFAFNDFTKSLYLFDSADIIINCTSLGMTPHIETTPVPDEFFVRYGMETFTMDGRVLPVSTKGFEKTSGDTGDICSRKSNLKNMTVMDIVYNPLTTRLLGNARENGCTVVDGLSMFVHQAAAQFELFTGNRPSPFLMRQIVQEHLNRHKG